MRGMVLKKVFIASFLVLSMFMRVSIVNVNASSKDSDDIKIVNIHNEKRVNTTATIDLYNLYSSKYICSYDVGLLQVSDGLELNASVSCIKKMDNISISVALMEKRGNIWYKVKTLSTSNTLRSECVLSRVSNAVDGRVYKMVVVYTVKIGSDTETRSMESSEKVYYK